MLDGYFTTRVCNKPRELINLQAYHWLQHAMMVLYWHNRYVSKRDEAYQATAELLDFLLLKSDIEVEATLERGRMGSSSPSPDLPYLLLSRQWWALEDRVQMILVGSQSAQIWDMEQFVRTILPPPYPAACFLQTSSQPGAWASMAHLAAGM